MIEDSDIIKVPLPRAIVDKIKERIKNTEFNTVSEYIVFVLKEVLEDKGQRPALTEEEEEQVKLTLKKLGYLKDE